MIALIKTEPFNGARRKAGNVLGMRTMTLFRRLRVLAMGLLWDRFER